MKQYDNNVMYTSFRANDGATQLRDVCISASDRMVVIGQASVRALSRLIKLQIIENGEGVDGKKSSSIYSLAPSC